MTSEFGGSSDFITSIGPDDSFIMLYSCPSCNTAPLRIRDWLYGRPSERSERWILLYNGEDAGVDHYVWGHSHTQQIETFCEDVTSWMK
eukprot:632621-Amphidinium_carterae.1